MILLIPRVLTAIFYRTRLFLFWSTTRSCGMIQPGTEKGANTMKPGKLKDTLDQTERGQEKKEILEAASAALTDGELDKVAGGMKIVVIKAPDFSDLP